MALFGAPNKLKVKICGLANLEDIKTCYGCGVDAVGFLVKDEKKHNPTDVLFADEAQKLITNSPPLIKKVLLIKFSEKEKVIKLIDKLKPDVIQIQKEAPGLDMVIAIKENFPEIGIIKTFTVNGMTTYEILQKDVDRFLPYVDAICLDSENAGKGNQLDPELCTQVAKYVQLFDCCYMLAGGIDAENINEKVREIKPNIVDIMSSVKLSSNTPERINATKVKRIMDIINDINQKGYEI